ncbi:uncharacterized protein LOC115427377 isoform X3 [Sphaeramia orbicularis]|uniref:uncharacterized protein LOC115427377 isoform X3 n=1 Tax=Sphaeramia orbicularis TaxID=375764 RepID=UPI0011801009|nr:uncharacterized protein LOC115427377 isoform X3 [Sphaeramia orbicularis]
MTEPMVAFMLLSTLSLIEAADVPQSVSSIVVKLGDNVSLYCPASDEERVIYLYKQPLGRLMQTVAVGVYGKLTANELFNDPRFSVTKKDALVVFTIRNINKDDEATYFCKVGSFFHAMSFINGTFLAVEAASVQPGDPVTVQCSLPSEDKENTIQDPGEHSEHWFRSGEYQPGIIYTHRTRTEEPDKRKCIYSLSKTAQDSSNSGTYYCAVAACGQILFGGGTKVETDTIQRTDVSHPISPAVVELGDTVTFSCPVPATETYFYWHKQPLGCMIQTVAEGFYGQSVNDMFNNSRFLFTQNNSERVFTIINVTKEDEALYFCQSGSSYGQNFINSTFLTVTDQRNRQEIMYVKQYPPAVSVQSGYPVSLQCSLLSEDKKNPVQCPGEHNVYWFRAGSGGYRPGIIYTHKKNTEEPDKRKCVYRLSKTIQDSSDSGTYYCAVATNGQILFGGGTKVEIRLDMVPVLGVVSACCAVMIAVLILYPRKGCKQAEGEISAVRYDGQCQSKNQDGEFQAASYAALQLLTMTETWDEKQREQASVYSVAVYDTQ